MIHLSPHQATRAEVDRGDTSAHWAHIHLAGVGPFFGLCAEPIVLLPIRLAPRRPEGPADRHPGFFIKPDLDPAIARALLKP